MKVIKPTPAQAAIVLKKFLEDEGVSVKLGRAQEAVARMLGYSSWNVLASDMDPKVGEKAPQGVLAQEGESEYVLTSGVQSTVWVSVANIDVHIKHDDEGVVVDLYPKASKDYVESLASTYASFDEASVDEDEDEDDTKVDRSESAVCQAIAAKTVTQEDTVPATPFLFKNEKALNYARDERYWQYLEPAAVALSFRTRDQSVKTITVGALMQAVQIGDSTWRLPSGDSVTFN